MWDELCYRYEAGLQQVREFQKVWDRTALLPPVKEIDADDDQDSDDQKAYLQVAHRPFPAAPLRRFHGELHRFLDIHRDHP